MKATLLQNTEINRTEWDILIAGSHQGSVFMETGFLDALLPGQWQGIIVEEGNELLAVMPLYINSKFGLSYALQPYLTKYWGVAFKDAAYTNTYKEYSWKKKYQEAILKAIPSKLAAFDYNFNPGYDYPLPFHWDGYTLKTRYTYYLDTHLFTMDEIFKNYGSSLKTNIRKGEKNGITVVEDSIADNLLDLLPLSQKTETEIAPKKYHPWFRALFDYGYPQGKCLSFTACDPQKKPIGSSLLITDKNRMYALSMVVHNNHRLSAASALLMHNIVGKAVALNLQLDMFGSMLEPVEAFDRHFGAYPVPYLNISKKNILLSAFGK